jgi:hypothetical protein
MADLLSAIALLEGTLVATANLRDDGSVEFTRSDLPAIYLGIAHGRGARTWGAMEAVLGLEESLFTSNPRPRIVLVSGVSGGKPAAISPPEDIVGPVPTGDIMRSDRRPELLGADELRAAPAEVAARIAVQ